MRTTKTFAKALLVIGLFIGPADSNGQQTTILKEQWAANPGLHALADKYSRESAIILQDKRRYEFVDGKDGVLVYKTLHKIIRVNDDKGIESYNRIYLGVSDNNDIVDIKARTVLPNGKIIEIDRNNIKDLKEENGNLYKIFAVEGLEKGCELEYYYTFKRYTTFFGKELIQGPYPTLQCSVELLCPKRLSFDMKSYNWTASPIETVIDERRSIQLTASDLPGVEKEKYAAYQVNLKRVEFKLSHNSALNSNERLFTWNELAQRVYRNYSTYTSGELRATDDLIHSNKWDKAGDDRDKIIAVESYIKKNFAVRDDAGENGEDVAKIIRSRIASNKGITRLYGTIFTKLGVDFQFVLTCDRSESVLDRAFENWENTDKTILFFPATKKFMAPTMLSVRYPWIYPYWAGTDGLFCKSTTIGNFTTAVGVMRNVPMEDISQNYSNIESTIRFNAGKDTLIVDMKQLYGGYASVGYRAGYNFSTPEEQRTMIKEMVKFGTNSENIQSSEIINPDFECFSDNKPFLLHDTVKTSELLEMAGNKLLVKIGDIIGPQVEMYQEKPRQLPMQLDYPHRLERKIDLIIPEDYTIKNLDALNIDHAYSDNGETTLAFTSSYTMEGNIVKIHVMEQYSRIFYPLEQYEIFKKVINASADFNKIVLVLEKK